ncbi:hypothetical protein TSUD_259460 [Trifolium subterraneum]|uniref:Uncharacterized protein n=1 Tax=Trifolium subterraneum TaxID=3900 RepID=A0A2Z6NAT7_TRISU|nr:hypothetical protein TSUD_259460 [Trifolium subterraneum]
MSNYARHSLIKPLVSSWKDPFKVKFYRIRPSPSSPQFFHDESGNILFPLYWTKNPSTKVKLRQLHCTPTTEKLVSLLQGMSFKATELFRCEGNQQALASLLQSKEMAPLTAEERRVAREKGKLVQGLSIPQSISRDIVTTSTAQAKNTRTKKARVDAVSASAIVSCAANPEHEFEPSGPSSTFFTPVQFACDDWRANLLVGKYEVKEGTSLWDSRFPLNEVVDQLTVPEDKKAIDDLGVEQSLDAIQSYSLWEASLAAESKKQIIGFSEQRRHYQSQNLELQGRVQELERQRKVLKDVLARIEGLLKEAEQKVKTSTQEYSNLEKAKEDLESSLTIVQEECEGLKLSAVHEYDNGFMSALGKVMEKFPGMDLKGINPD